MKVSTEIDNNFGYEKITQLVDNIPLSWTPNKLESCINWTLNKVQIYEIFVNLTCINQTPVYSEHKSWSQVVRLSQVLL
jgi:hypothetical protein